MNFQPRSVAGKVSRRCGIGLNAARELTCYHDEDNCRVIRARLPAEQGAVGLEALEAAMEAQRAEADEAASEDVTAVTSAGENRFCASLDVGLMRDSGCRLPRAAQR